MSYSRLGAVFGAVLLCLVGTMARAQEDELKTTAGLEWSTRRIFRGVAYSRGTAQGAVELSQHGWCGRVETHAATTGGRADETDLSVSYGAAVTEVWRLEAGAIQRWRSGLSAGAATAMTEAGLAAVWTGRDGIRPKLTACHDFKLRAEICELSLEVSQALTSLGAYAEWRFFAGWATADDLLPGVAGVRVHDAYGYYAAEVRMPYRIGAQTSIVAGAGIAGNTGQSPAWAPREQVVRTGGWLSIGVSVDF